ncbi:glycosyl hydrolase [Sphingosinicella ginsenosidimutans]|uniref:Endoglucanase n=2 Tax=Allosphingosinicella ginsenosidimutans TaxID=1176539 RepID=A0A5C6TZF5_9SPHN|nr:glycosyl hydrolase [Sphingosinicella ginsenosidimutans]
MPIRMSQIGFLPGGPKRAILPDPAPAPIPWRLLDRAGAPVASGMSGPAIDDAASGETVHVIDFSTASATGDGFVLEAGGARSRPFAIAPNLFGRLPFDALNIFYQSRASTPIEARYAGGDAWARPAGHAPDRAACISGRDADGNVWGGCPYTLDASRGWYDAGDHGKYLVNGGIAVWTLLNLWERAHSLGRPAPFPDGSARLPEAGNGVDDLLDEARWEVEFMLAMQVPAGTHLRLPVGETRSRPGLRFTEIDASGMAHHKIADARWTALPTPPQDDRETRLLYPPSTGATLNLAAVAAQCARIWRTIDAAFSARCLDAARRAYAAAKRNPEIHSIAAFTGSGGYGDDDFSDEFFWAAAELYATTGEPSYGEDLRASRWFAAPIAEPEWRHTATLGAMTLALAPDRLPPPDRAALRGRIVAAADRFLGEEQQSGYRIPFAGTDYVWGSNAVLLNRAMLMALADDFTGEARYRAGVFDVMDYLLGRNPLDRSFISGYGARPMANPHHRFWAHSLDPRLPPPPPGLVSGGPNSVSLRADAVGAALAGHCAPQMCWRDDIRAFSMNEVAINWNAPLVWVSTWLAEPPPTPLASRARQRIR